MAFKLTGGKTDDQKVVFHIFTEDLIVKLVSEKNRYI